MSGAFVLATLLAAAAIIPAVEPSASPTPNPSALKEIGHVRATTALCKALVEPAVRAVDIEDENDRRLADVETFLGTVDLDSSELAKHRGNADLTKRYVTLRAAAVEGAALMKKFRSDAKNAPTDDQRAALVAFADALDGALHRQKTLADDLGRLIAYIDAHPPIDRETRERLEFEAVLHASDPSSSRNVFDQRNYFGPLSSVPDPLSTTAKNAAEDLTARALPLGGDEDSAAARIDPAFAAC